MLDEIDFDPVPPHAGATTADPNSPGQTSPPSSHHHLLGGDPACPMVGNELVRGSGRVLPAPWEVNPASWPLAPRPLRGSGYPSSNATPWQRAQMTLLLRFARRRESPAAGTWCPTPGAGKPAS